MLLPLIQSKLFVPPTRRTLVPRPRLLDRLNESADGRLTLVSAPAGFGKTTLVSEWVATGGRPVAWLSLDKGDNDPTRFLAYLVAALRGVLPTVGEELLRVLNAPQPQPPSIESLLPTLLNEIALFPTPFVLVLDDCHVIEAQAVNRALAFLLDHLPPPIHLLIATREDPPLPLARLRARGQLTELRAADLRFTFSEAADFLNRVMSLGLSASDIDLLESRTEGWIAGLQLAALSMQGQEDTASFIQSFTGSHRFVMDYLVEEVLQKQPEPIQSFLLRTSILERLCGPLCEAVLLDPPGAGQAKLEYLEQANLFVIPLDNERRWYRYHHLFAELLRQRLPRSRDPAIGDTSLLVNALHLRASQWYEENGLEIEAFRHAAAAHDLDRAERLMDGGGIPLHLRGAVLTILEWLGSLPKRVLDSRPSLWWRYGAMLLVVGQTTGVEEKLDAAEAAIQGIEADDSSRHLLGRIAAARAVLALTRYQADIMLAQSRRALAYLPPTNLPTRANAYWTLGYGYLFRGDRAEAREALSESVALSQACGDTFTMILATIGLGNIAEGENYLHGAAEIYRRVLQWAGDQPLQIIAEAHLGLARVFYEWNDLNAAERHARDSLHLARQYDRVIDRFILSELFLARLLLARGEVGGAAVMLDQSRQAAQQDLFHHRLPDVAAVQGLLLLRQGHLAAAAHLAAVHPLPLLQARVHLARGEAAAALAVLEAGRQKPEASEPLKVMLLQAIAFHANGEEENALHALREALAQAEPGGFVRLFVDEGPPMAHLLSRAAARGVMPDYIRRLLAVFEAEGGAPPQEAASDSASATSPLVEPLSERELEVLHLIAQGLSNREIGERLFLALDTVKGHNRRLFDKLQVQRRTEAVARARELGLL